mgnify:CR=1 FL=1
MFIRLRCWSRRVIGIGTRSRNMELEHDWLNGEDYEDYPDPNDDYCDWDDEDSPIGGDYWTNDAGEPRLG